MDRWGQQVRSSFAACWCWGHSNLGRPPCQGQIHIYVPHSDPTDERLPTSFDAGSANGMATSAQKFRTVKDLKLRTLPHRIGIQHQLTWIIFERQRAPRTLRWGRIWSMVVRLRIIRVRALIMISSTISCIIAQIRLCRSAAVPLFQNHYMNTNHTSYVALHSYTLKMNILPDRKPDRKLPRESCARK